MNCDCGEKLLICDSGMRLCSVGCKDRWVNSKGEPIVVVEEEEQKVNDGLEVSEIMWREKKYLREMATGDLYTWDTCVKIGTMDKHGKVLLLEEIV